MGLPERHDCPGGCGVTLPPSRFACYQCTRRLPRELRDALGYAAACGYDSTIYQAAQDRAREWFIANPML